jgi:hypothetical protein
VADHPLRPATDYRLGEPLPHQLPNLTRAHLSAINLSSEEYYTVLAFVSKSYSILIGRFPRVTHPSATNHNLKQALNYGSFDLHVLSIPPAFVLSQDQTLKFLLVCFIILKKLT